MNFRHLFSCDAIGYWVYHEDFKNHCTGVKHLSLVIFLSRYIINNEFPVSACFKRLLEGKGFNGTQQFQNLLGTQFG